MIYKKIAKRIKESGCLGVFEGGVSGETHSWICAGNGIYDSSELPEMNSSQICAMFDFPKKLSDSLRECSDEAERILGKASVALGTAVYEEPATHRTYIGDNEVKVFIAKENPETFAIISVADLSPIVETDYTRFVLTSTPRGETFVVVYEGMQLIAVICPISMSTTIIEIWRNSISKIDACFSSVLRRFETSGDIAQYTLDEDGEEDAE